jgi:RHS repeat-associated protein
MSKLLHIRTAEQCLEEASRQPAPKMLFDELWFENELCIFFADTNVGKSILAVQIADAIARGQPMEGFRLEGPPRPVLYLDFELSDKQFEKRYSEEYQNHYPFSQNLMRAGFSPGLSQLKIRSSALFSEVEEHLVKTGCRIVIVDNLSYLSEDALENAQEANALMKDLKVLKERLGLSILLLAHTPKRLRHKPLGKGDLAGSSGLSRFADALFADHKGERVMKSSVMHSSVQVNDKNIDDVQYLEPYTLYINPYYVVTELQGGDKVSKHYYMNTQRVATDISINYQAQESMAGPQQPNARDPKKPSEDTASVNYNAAFADLQATLNALGHQKIDVNGLGQQPTLEEYYPELVRETALNTTAAKNAPESTTRVLFWYHPDYLGNVDLVTERDGKTYEFFTYNPWGEEMHQYNANTFGFSSPYRFNSKEKDEETGLHYYGARYYQSKLSVWMSVDPLAHETLEPYVFTGNNALTFVDPDGRAIDVRYLLLADNKYGNDVTKNVIADLEEITGLTITVSDKGLLEYAKDENGLAIVDESVNSSEARNMLTSAIDNEKETLLVYDVKNGSQADHGGLRMGLDNNQINGFINGATGVNNKTMGFGMTFLHELDHTALGSGNDDSKGLGKTGDVVDRMNIIRSQMGESWGQRLSYSALKQNGRSYIPMSPMSLSEIKDGRAPFGGKYIHY